MEIWQTLEKNATQNFLRVVISELTEDYCYWKFLLSKNSGFESLCYEKN